MLIQIRNRLKGKKAQNTLEYAALIAVIVGAIIAVNAYMKRGVQGQLRSAADDIGTQYDIEKGGYHKKTDLTGTEITHSVMGKTTELSSKVTLPNLTWVEKDATVAEGTEAQWTKQTAPRTIKEQVTTDKEADADSVE